MTTKKIKTKTTKQGSSYYKKILDNPLNWCPLFGYLPNTSNEHFQTDKIAFDLASECLGIIKSARLNWGIADIDMIENDPLPEIKHLPISIYHGYGEIGTAVRLLFQNLDYLALKTSNAFVHGIYTNLFNKNIENRQPGSIRKSGYYTNGLNTIVEDITVLEVVPDHLLSEAKKITGDVFDLELHHLYSLYAILEAWLILIFLLCCGNNSEKSFLYKNIYKTTKLLQAADSYAKIKQDEPLQKRLYAMNQGVKRGGKNKTNAFIKAINDIRREKGNINYISIWNYFKKNHKGKRRAYKLDNIHIIYWENDRSGENPEGLITALNKKTNKPTQNKLKSFQTNFYKAKKR